jgi:hypothetical protein
MAEKLSPKAELIVTLDKAWETMKDPTPVNLVILRGLLDHARAVAKRVGQEARPRKALRAAS